MRYIYQVNKVNCAYVVVIDQCSLIKFEKPPKGGFSNLISERFTQEYRYERYTIVV